MKSSDDELNDAIKNALKTSLGNFERKPGASLDERIYKKLGHKPSRKPLWAAFGLLAVIGVLSLWYVNAGRKEIGAVSTKPVTGNVTPKALPEQNKAKINVKNQGRETVLNTTAEAPSAIIDDPKVVSENRVAVKKKARIQSENQSPATQSGTLDLPQNTKTNAQQIASADEQAYGNFVAPTHIGNIHVTELDLHHVLKYPALPLPMITAPLLATTPDSILQNVADKKSAGSWKPAMLVNFSGTNTSQSVYLLPSAHSRILKVSFPNSLANIGYKIGVGMQVKSYQLMLNYSHLQYQTEFVYALEEFTAVPTNASYNFRRLGAARVVKSAFDVVGLAARKHFDFETKPLGALYAQIGMEYSRSVSGSDQQLLAATIAAGKRIFTGPKATILIGPFFEYNIIRMLTAEENVKIRTNQVGISLGLKFNN
ncbi:hypothetical protein [Dyadobacter sp. CY351]|uniref:hypothetical protein n=1 Tax=Dyadobacter sp. CY351 TaxID=2909337 RepID=UPI001F2E3645|nr:hypothetical protein [Dyadobacter sp. CY351]MCF2519173.1 hypothetical protein [Dyadobacter sp. CY351]